MSRSGSLVPNARRRGTERASSWVFPRRCPIGLRGPKEAWVATAKSWIGDYGTGRITYRVFGSVSKAIVSSLSRATGTAAPSDRTDTESGV